MAADVVTARTRPLFLIGNKRSGTSHFVRLLNLHPNVFVTHESDVIWLLYRWNAGEPFVTYPWDGPVGMNATLQACGSLLDQPRTAASPPVAELFTRIQVQLMRHGSAVQQSYRDKAALAWLGDKKPVQHADPSIHAFITAHFADARFIHLLRHPRATVASMLAAGGTWAKVGYWNDANVSAILDRWVVHERWAQAVAAHSNGAVLQVRLEDLTAEPRETMARVLSFLDVDAPAALLNRAAAATGAAPNDKHARFELPPHGPARELMQLYGYD